MAEIITFPKDTEDEKQLFLRAEYYSKLTVIVTVVEVQRGAQQPGENVEFKEFMSLKMIDFNGA